MVCMTIPLASMRKPTFEIASIPRLHVLPRMMGFATNQLRWVMGNAPRAAILQIVGAERALRQTTASVTSRMVRGNAQRVRMSSIAWADRAQRRITVFAMNQAARASVWQVRTPWIAHAITRMMARATNRKERGFANPVRMRWIAQEGVPRQTMVSVMSRKGPDHGLRARIQRTARWRA